MARVPHPTKKQHAALTYKEPMLVRFGRYGSIGGLVLLILAVLYTGGWFATSMLLRSSIQDWFSAQSAQGYLAEYKKDKARIDGFPFTVRATLHDVVLAAPTDTNGRRAWTWAPKQLAFNITPLPWSFDKVHVDFSHRQKLTMNGQTFEGRAKKAELAFDWIAKGIPDQINLTINKAQFTTQRQSRLFKIDRLSALLERQSDDSYHYDINGQDVGLPLYISGMGNTLSEIILRGTLNNSFGKQGLDATALTQWRDSGGTLEATRAQLGFGPLLLQGNGTMALDENLQLVGAFSARIQGFFKAIDRLSRAGVVRGPDASMAKVVLGMLSKQPQNGGAATISLPITLQERGLYAGPVRLIEMPQIQW